VERPLFPGWLSSKIVVVRAPKISSALHRAVELCSRGAVASRRPNLETGLISPFWRYRRGPRFAIWPKCCLPFLKHNAVFERMYERTNRM
jgi:hypothetical protein